MKTKIFALMLMLMPMGVHAQIRFKALQHLSKVNIPLSGMLVDRRLESIALF